jgi:DNA-binding response OmpR family regulator
MERCALLHVEDDDSAAVLFRLALNEAELAVSVYRVSDGEQALQFLHKSHAYANAPTPKVIVLDLNLPKRDGWSVLAERRTDHYLWSIPVIVLSTAPAHLHQARAISNGAQLYLEKPYDFDMLVTQVKDSCQPFLCLH